MPDVKTPAERGPVGAWAYQARDDAGLSVPQVVSQLAERGSAVTESTIRGIEGGSKKPGRRTLRELAAIYGAPLPGAPDPEPDGDLAAAIRDQADAIRALVDELRQGRAEQAAWTSGVTRVLEMAEANRWLEAPTTLPEPQPHGGAPR